MPWPWDEDSPTAPPQPGFDPERLNPNVKRALTRRHLPTAGEILEEKERQQREAQSGLLSTVLGLPEKVLFGQAIKGAVEGGARDGFSGAVEGFARGSPFAFLWDTINDLWDGKDVARVTDFAEIRKAFGATDVDEGAGNFFINLLGDIALSPIELFAAPLALTKAGVAAKAGAKSLSEALEVGHRAALVLKVPFKDLIIGSTNLGMKSGFALPVKMLDGLGNLARTNPVAKAISSVFEASYNLPTLDSQVRAKKALDVSATVQKRVMAVAEQQFRAMSPEARRIAENAGLGDLLTTAREVGIDTIDFHASPDGVLERLRNPDVARREVRREARYKSDETFRALWDDASKTAGASGFGRRDAAIRAIIKQYPDVPLTDDMLAAVGMERRIGVETSWIGEATPAIGDPQVPRSARAAVADAAQKVPKNLVEGGPYRVSNRRRSIDDLIELPNASGKFVAPRKGFLYRDFSDIGNMSRDASGRIVWNPEGRAAAKDFGWASFDTGFLVEFPHGGDETLRAGGSYKGIGINEWATPASKAGRPSRIIYAKESVGSLPPDPKTLRELEEAFPDAEFVVVEPSWKTSDGNIVEESRNALKYVDSYVPSQARDASKRGLEAPGVSMAQAARADTAEAVQADLFGKVREGREKVVSDFAKLREEVAAGRISADAFNEVLAYQHNVLKTIGVAEMEQGIINDSLEPFLGIYAPHIMSERVMDLVNNRFLSVAKQYKFDVPRHLKDMTALEANIVAHEIGLRSTGFVPLKDLNEKKALAVWQKVFDNKWIKELHKVDPEAASVFRALHDEGSFFRINPLANIKDRVRASADRQAARAMQKEFYSAMAVEDLSPQEFALRQAEFAENTDLVAVLETKGGFEPLTKARAVEEYGLVPEAEAEFLVAREMANTDFHTRIQSNSINAENALKDLQSSRLLHENSAAEDLVVREQDLLATANMKRAVLEQREATVFATAAKDLVRYHRAKVRGAIKIGEEPDIDALYHQLKKQFDDSVKPVMGSPGDKGNTRIEQLGRRARRESFEEFLASYADEAAAELKFAKSQTNTFRAAIQSMLDEQLDAADLVTEGYKKQRPLVRQQARDTAANIAATRKATIDVAGELRARGLDARRVAVESQIQKAIARDGGLALDEARNIVVGTAKDGKPITLFDRVFNRLDPATRIKVLRREEFKGFRAMQDDLMKPDALRHNSFFRMLDNMKAAWANHTVNHPMFIGTRVRNVVQNMTAQVSSGLWSMSGQFESVKVSNALRLAAEGDTKALEALANVTVKGTNVTLKEAFDLALQNGAVTFSSAYASEVGSALNRVANVVTTKEAVGNAAKYAKANPVKALMDMVIPPFLRKGDSPLYQVGSQMEAGLDQWQRFAAFLGGLKKGMTAEAAGQAVRKTLYDSSLPLTFTERSIFRRVLPFYSFHKYALRNFSELYLSRPASVSWFDKAQKNAKRSQGVEDIDAVLPPFVTESFGIVTKNDANGPKVRLFGGWFNIGEAAAVASAIERDTGGEESRTNGVVRYFLTKMHPVLRIALEQVTNTDFFSDKDLEAYPGEPGEFLGMVMPKRSIRIVQQLRFLNELHKIHAFTAREFRAMANGVANESLDRQPGMALLRSLRSSAFSPVPWPGEQEIKVEQEVSYRQSKDEAKLREVKGRILRTLGKDASPEQKKVELETLRDIYKKTSGRLLRRAEAAQAYDLNPTKADVQQRRRLQLRRIAGTGE